MVLCCRAPSAFLWTACTDPVSRRKAIKYFRCWRNRSRQWLYALSSMLFFLVFAMKNTLRKDRGTAYLWLGSSQGQFCSCDGSSSHSLLLSCFQWAPGRHCTDPCGSLDALGSRDPFTSSSEVIATGQKETFFKHSWLVLRWITESLNSDASREHPVACNICATETQTKLWKDKPWRSRRQSCVCHVLQKGS